MENEVLKQMPQEDRDAATQLLELYLRQANEEQASLIERLISKNQEILQLTRQEAFLVVGVAVQDAAATSALSDGEWSLDDMLRLLDENLEVFIQVFAEGDPEP